MVNWVGAKKTNKAYEEAERKKREKLLKKIKEKRDKPELNLMSDALKEYKKKIGDNYEHWTLGARALLNADSIEKRIRRNGVVEFKAGLSHKCGSKYIKVTKNLGDQTSVHSFIVNTHDDKKFNYGDILKAASWKAPARNFARGNIFEEYKVRWVGM